MAYTNPYIIKNGLILDFTIDAGNSASDSFLAVDADGSLTSLSGIPSSRITGVGSLTEATSSVLTITGGTNSVLGNVSVQVKLAGAVQSGYLSSTDWNIFNDKLSDQLDEHHIFVGNALGIASEL